MIPEMNEPIVPGQPIRAVVLEAIRQEILRLSSMSVEGMEMVNTNNGRHLRVVPQSLIRRAVTTSVIGAADGADLGTGTAALKRIRGGTVEDIEGADDIEILNDGSVAIPSGKKIYVMRVDGSAWVVLWEEC